MVQRSRYNICAREYTVRRQKAWDRGDKTLGANTAVCAKHATFDRKVSYACAQYFTICLLLAGGSNIVSSCGEIYRWLTDFLLHHLFVSNFPLQLSQVDSWSSQDRIARSSTVVCFFIHTAGFIDVKNVCRSLRLVRSDSVRAASQQQSYLQYIIL